MTRHLRYIILPALLLLCAPSGAQEVIKAVDEQTSKEEEIEVPENMTQDLDSLLSQWYSKSYLSQDESCNMKNENPLYSDDEIMDRLRRMPTIIDMPFNNVIRKFIDYYSGRLRRSVGYMLAANNFYMPIFEEALESYGVPMELKYLPIIESALNPKARSRAGAVGLWQFMLSAAKMYDLKVNSLVDERMDPVKSSYAAAHLLKDMYGVFGDWHLAIASYNCGAGNVTKAIRRNGDQKDYWTIYNSLPKETRGYVPAFIAANYIMNYYCDHNICPYESRLPLQTDTIHVSKDFYMEQISEACGITIEEIEALNPQYRTHLIPGASFDCILRLPSQQVSTFVSMEDSIYALKRDQYETKKTRITDVDESSAPRSRSRKGRSGRSSRSSRGSSSSSAQTHVVKSGESLYTIAKRNGTTADKLKRLNGIKGNMIRPGQKIKVK